MNEERCEFKASMPLITEEDLRLINNNYDNVVNSFITRIVKDKDLAIAQYIIQKQQMEIEEQKKENTDLKDLYIRTAKHLDKKGKYELSEYMLAQIGATPTFTTWEEYITWINKQDIRDRIEELNNMKVLSEEHRFEITYAIGILQELLEDK